MDSEGPDQTAQADLSLHCPDTFLHYLLLQYLRKHVTNDNISTGLQWKLKTYLDLFLIILDFNTIKWGTFLLQNSEEDLIFAKRARLNL